VVTKIEDLIAGDQAARLLMAVPVIGLLGASSIPASI